MNRKNMPLVLMLTAGIVTYVITFIRKYPLQEQLFILLLVLVIFYILGSVLKGTLDYFDKQNEELEKAKEAQQAQSEEAAEGAEESSEGQESEDTP